MNLLIQVFECEMAVNSTRVDQPQRMTSLLVKDGFSGRQNHLSIDSILNIPRHHKRDNKNLSCCQESQLLQRDCAMLHVIVGRV